MYRVIKIMRTKNDKLRQVTIRKFSSRDMAEFVAACIATLNLHDEDVIVGYQRC